MKNIMALLIEPGKEPQLVFIEPTGKRIGELVGGLADFTWPIGDSIAIAVNDTGKLDGLPLNRSIRDADGNLLDVYAGNMLVMGDHGGEEFDSLTADEIIHVVAVFGQPENWNGEKVFSEFGCESGRRCP